MDIWWHVYPLGFCDAPIRVPDPAPGHRLRRLLNWLDYAVQLGVNGLLLGPVFASQTHGYDSLDQFRIDPRLGTDEDFDDLMRACRERGLSVLLDGVFNHVGAGHPMLGTEGFARPDRRAFEGHDTLVTLDHRSPQVSAYVRDVMNHWMDRGVRGWRLDAAYAVDPDFWQDVLPQVRERHPGAWFVGEVIHGDYPEFVSRSGVDSVTQYELWKAIWSSLRERNFFELDWALRRHNEFLDRFPPATFVGNHDVTRIASRADPILALTVLMTVGGVPSVYYGDEQGFRGVKEERLGGDDAVRPAFPQRPEELASWGAEIYRTHQFLIGLRRRNPWLFSARTETVELTNTRYVYRATGKADGESLTVELDVTQQPRASVRDAQGQVLWSR
ncbi:alpha-amylase family protein [Mangrovihabitans endophyticus]|uniref:alpha-amylase family protein n=1 Tax=Mangrovihabitans endophyticus TaxID=1751298 RepID=UPI001E5A60CE|nr:alpha-amylase family protein [Mangrovihabitans endophyticus]